MLANKAEFVMVLIDYEEMGIKQTIDMVEQFKLDKIKFYRFNSSIFDEMWPSYYYGVTYLPTIVGVNSEGNIFYSGKDKDIKFDEFFQTMITGAELPVQKMIDQAEKYRFTKEQHKKLKAALKEI